MEIPTTVLSAARRIRLFLFDVDGVLTDASLYIRDDGVEIKAFNSRDGAWLKYLPRNGIRTGIITGRKSGVVARRAAELGMEILVQGAKNKAEALQGILEQTGLAPRDIAYMGDDLVDLPVISRVGLSFAPSDAHPEVLRRVSFVTSVPGGRGAAREAAEVVLRARGAYENIVKGYLERT